MTNLERSEDDQSQLGSRSAFKRSINNLINLEFIPNKKEEGQELLDIKYVIPYEWGSFSISHAADLQYNLQPKVGHINYGMGTYNPKYNPSGVNIRLLSEEELFLANHKNIDTITPLSYASSVNGKSIEVLTAFSSDPDIIKNEYLENVDSFKDFYQDYGVDLSDMSEQIMSNYDPESFTELRLFLLSKIIPDISAELIMNNMLTDQNNKTKRSIMTANIGAAAITGAFAGTEIILGSVNQEGLIGLGLYASFVSVLFSRPVIKKHLDIKKSIDNYRSYSYDARLFAQQIGNDIYSSFNQE